MGQDTNGKFLVGYFDGAANEHFQELRRFKHEPDARDYVAINYTDDADGQPQNVAIKHNGVLIYDGRTTNLN